MKWLYRHLHKKEKGFTLVELMVVIIILAVLTGIAIPSYLALRNRARNQATRSEMQNIGTAISIYEADIGSNPATGLAALTTALETEPVVEAAHANKYFVLSIFVDVRYGWRGANYFMEIFGEAGERFSESIKSVQ